MTEVWALRSDVNSIKNMLRGSGLRGSHSALTGPDGDNQSRADAKENNAESHQGDVGDDGIESEGEDPFERASQALGAQIGKEIGGQSS